MNELLNSQSGTAGLVIVGLIGLMTILVKKKNIYSFFRADCRACEVYKQQLDRRETDNITLQKENRELNETLRQIGIKSRGINKKP